MNEHRPCTWNMISELDSHISQSSAISVEHRPSILFKGQEVNKAVVV